MNRNSRYELLLNPVFLGCVALLLINDHFLKYAYPGFVTGKLSDLAGLIVLPVFLIALSPIDKKIALLVAGLFFIWWKLPLSQPVIDWLNRINFPAGRTVDYTDLLALIVLPFASLLRPWKVKINGRYPATVLSAFVTIITLCATSQGYRFMTYQDKTISIDKKIKTKLTVRDIEDRLIRAGLEFSRDSFYYRKYESRNVYLVLKDSQNNEKTVRPDEHDIDVVHRFDYSPPFYIVKQIVIGSDTLENLRFMINDQGKKRVLEFLTFDLRSLPDSGNNNLKIQARQDLEKPLKKELKRIVE